MIKKFRDKLNSFTIFSLVFLICIMFFCCLTIGDLASRFSNNTNIVSQEKSNWETLYPFENEINVQKPKAKKTIYELLKYAQVLLATKDTDLPFERKFLELNALSLRAMNTNIIPGATNLVKLNEGNITQLIKNKPTNIKESVQHISSLSNYVNDKNIPFVYAIVPDAISENDNQIPKSFTYFNNEIIDEIIDNLKIYNIDYIDLRKEISDRNIKNTDLFFKTDHHWKPSTGLLTANILAEHLNLNYNANLNLDLLKTDQFEEITYENIMFGSRGQNATIAYAPPEDFVNVIPKYDTSFSMEIPSKSINENGDFSAMINEDKFVIDYYKNNAYSSFIYGNNALTTIENKNSNNNKKVLIIKDSYANVVVPYIALTTKYTDVIDFRNSQEDYFDGNIKSYIDKTNPDFVIFLGYQKTTTEEPLIANMSR